MPLPPAPWTITLKRINHHLHRLTGKRFIAQWSWINARRHAKQIKSHLAKHPVDVLLSITVDQPIAALKDSPVPVIHHSDTTSHGIAEYYRSFSNLWWFSRRSGDKITREAIRNANLSVYQARWSADSAINEYDVDPEHVHVLPYGANLSNPPSRDEAIDCTSRDKCRLLWIGVDWDRKRGQLTYDTMVELNRRGIESEMLVVALSRPNPAITPT
ncbi:MAG: glycosyltransferase [Planctomycetota bacterium]